MIKDHYQKQFKKGNYQLALIYKEQYKKVYAKFIEVLEKRLNENKQLLIGKTVLDIGCYTGDFLELLYYKQADVYGIELQSDAVKIANKKLPNRIFQADVTSFAFPQKKYDIITILGVIEHVTDPLNLIKNAYKLLKKEGIIMIQTPNSASLLAKIMKKYWPPYSPIEHINLFSKKSLELALTDCGFTKIESQNHWKKLPISYIYKNLSSFGPEFHEFLKPLDPLLKNSSLTLPFYVGEMIVTAIKK
jgi:2-polyprenyl-3-methyl-5-hydroxy-6-metoxy-1,4-benzoquinol methylase